MAIQETVFGEETVPPVSNTGNGAAQQQRAPKRNFNISGFEPIGANIGSEMYTELKRQLGEILKTDDIEFFILDMNKEIHTNLYYSGIIIAERIKVQPSVIAYQILLLSGTADPIKPLIESINNTTVEVTRLPSDAYDSRIREIANNIINKAFPNTRSICVSCCIVPETFNVKDPAAVRRLAHNASTATNTELLYRSNQYQPINLSEVDNNLGLTIALQFANQQMYGADSLPFRSSVVSEFCFRPNARTQDRSLNNGAANQTITQVSGFIDAVYVPVAGASGTNPWLTQQQNTQRPTQKFMPRFVITDINCHALTPDMVLLAIATSFPLRDDSNWIQTFRPSSNRYITFNITDIGALNIDANIANETTGYGTRIDTNTQTFTLGELGSLVATMFRPELAISLDVPDAGPSTWYTDLFVAASRGDNSAYNVIYNAANVLTGGRFERHFAMGQSMFTDVGNRVHLGYWTNKNGEKCDIRDIDHLAVCNIIGEINPTLIREWSDTWVRTQVPAPIRLAARKKMISSLTNETAIFTGWAERLTFTAAFTGALSNAIRDTGLPVNVTTPLASSDFNNQRGIASWAVEAGLAMGQSFAPAFNNQVGFNYNMGNQGWSRW